MLLRCQPNAACVADPEKVNIIGLAGPHCHAADPTSPALPCCQPNAIHAADLEKVNVTGSPACAAALPAQCHPCCHTAAQCHMCCQLNAACAANPEKANVAGLAGPHCHAAKPMPPALPTQKRQTSQGSLAHTAMLPTQCHPRCHAANPMPPALQTQRRGTSQGSLAHAATLPTQCCPC